AGVQAVERRLSGWQAAGRGAAALGQGAGGAPGKAEHGGGDGEVAEEARGHATTAAQYRSLRTTPRRQGCGDDILVPCEWRSPEGTARWRCGSRGSCRSAETRSTP